MNKKNINSAEDSLLSVNDLRVYFRTRTEPIRAVDGVSFDIAGGETAALVGESGSGKSVTALALTRLVPVPGYYAGGAVLFNGRDVLKLDLSGLSRLRGAEISYIFQEPSQSLNPVFTIGYQIAEALRLHRGKILDGNIKKVGRGVSAEPSEKERLTQRVRPTQGGICRLWRSNLDFHEETLRLLNMVGIPDAAQRIRSYPHELSGGMQQRVMIAMALACRPKLLVADEPTTALDVTVQAQILGLLARLQAELGMAVLLITHNLGIVAGMARRVNVMYAGRIVETGLTGEILKSPAHPYTRGLLAAVPRLRSNAGRMSGIPGTVPSPANLPAGCKFHPRCPYVQAVCRQTEPLEEKATPTHGVKCHFWKSII
jgi:oligopeptide/dipeptide ABC transporter ATP-binding protein